MLEKIHTFLNRHNKAVLQDVKEKMKNKTLKKGE